MVKRIRQKPCECFTDEQWLMACPLHAAAPDMLALLRTTLERIDEISQDTEKWVLVGGDLASISASIRAISERQK